MFVNYIDRIKLLSIEYLFVVYLILFSSLYWPVFQGTVEGNE